MGWFFRNGKHALAYNGGALTLAFMSEVGNTVGSLMGKIAVMY